jgi:hypothetical protein
MSDMNDHRRVSTAPVAVAMTNLGIIGCRDAMKIDKPCRLFNKLAGYGLLLLGVLAQSICHFGLSLTCEMPIRLIGFGSIDRAFVDRAWVSRAAGRCALNRLFGNRSAPVVGVIAVG